MTPFGWLFQRGRSTGPQSPVINKSGPGNVTVNYQLLTAQEKEEFADSIVRKLRESSAVPGLPGSDRALTDAVGNIAAGADAGDTRLERALDLLATNKLAAAEPLLQAFAEAKTAQIMRDRKDAATAYRNLGAIAGLRDPKRALEAYARAADLDSDDLDSQFWAGWLAKDRGELTTAEQRLRHTLAKATDQDWLSFWSRLGLADIATLRGDLAAALTSYRASLTIAERLAQADPGNAGWQRDLSVSHNRIGDVQQAQGDLAAALTSYRASLTIRARLAQADPGNAGWQRDLALSHGRFALIERRQGARDNAIKAFQKGRDIIAQLMRRAPDNVTLPNDLAWFDGQLNAHEE